MILIIGAQASGKREYVKTLGYTDEDIAEATLDERPIIIDLQELVAKDPENAMSLIPKLLDKEVVICNEVGSGVIPVAKNERQSREQTGRLCIQLAQNAEKVVRLVCGIPTVIKG